MKNITRLLVLALYMIPTKPLICEVTIVDGDKKRTEENFEEMRRKKQEYFDRYYQQYGEYHPNDPRSHKTKTHSHCPYDGEMNFVNPYEGDNPFKRYG
jgi:hypothetical protein